MSSLTTITFEETIDIKILERLLANPDLLTTWIDDNGVERDDRKQLINIHTNIDAGKLKVNYKFSNNTPSFGRVYPKNLISLGACQRSIRGTLTKGTYIDIDIVNAHPNMILSFLQRYNFPHATYLKYCSNRQKYIKKVQREYGCSRDEAKLFFIVAGYGSSYRSWRNGLTIDVNGDKLESLFICFKTEAKLLADKFIDIHSKRFKAWEKARKKNYNEDYGFLAMVLQDEERQVLETMLDFLRSEGIIRGNNVILCHDGLMIKRKSIDDETLKMLENHIKEKHSFNFKIINKPLEHYLDKLVDVILIDQGDPFDLEYFRHLPRYSDKKEYFERFTCKIINSSQFILLNIRDDTGYKQYSHTTMSKDKIKASFENYPSHSLFTEDDVKLKKKAPPKFINKWLSDPEMRIYLYIEWTPYNGLYRQTHPDIFNLFTGYSPAIATPLPDNHEKQIAPLLDILLHLCENKQHCLDFLLHWLAHAIQNPNEKMDIALIFTGEQGTGKSTLIKLLGLIMGSSHVKSDADINTFIGSHAEGLVEKIAVCVEESEATASYGMEGKIKNLVTEDMITVDKKNIRPYSARNIARMIFNSNKLNVVVFDAVTGERRFIAWLSAMKYSHGKYAKWWENFYKHMKTPEFIASIYHYLNNIDLSNYNFSTMRHGVLTETYRDMARQHLPPVADWIGDFIKRYEEDEDIWNDSTRETIDYLWKAYLNFQNKYRPDTGKDSGYVGSAKGFKSKIKALKLPMEYKRGIKDTYEFVPSMVYSYLTSKNWIAGACEIKDDIEVEMVEFKL